MPIHLALIHWTRRGDASRDLLPSEAEWKWGPKEIWDVS